MTSMDSTPQQPPVHYLHPRYRLSVVKGGVLCYSPDGFPLTAALEDQMLHSMRSIWLGMVCGCFAVWWALNVAYHELPKHRFVYLWPPSPHR